MVSGGMRLPCISASRSFSRMEQMPAGAFMVNKSSMFFLTSISQSIMTTLSYGVSAKARSFVNACEIHA
jgi:hypothetical protein